MNKRDLRRHFFLLITIAVFAAAGAVKTHAQEIVDKTVAVVSDGAHTGLITYSDLLWQLALQPNTPIDPPRSEDLNQALQTLINQRIFGLEADRLPRNPPTEKEIADEIASTLAFFPSTAVFESRLKQVGFESVKDDGFQRLISRRLAIKKYVDFRFSSFVVITADDETKYFRDVYTPEFRRRNPGLLLPTYEEKKTEVHDLLTRQKVASAIETFLDDAKRRVEIEILIEV